MSFTLYKRRGSPHWHISITVPGRQRLRTSARTPDKQRARALAEAIEAKEWKRRTAGDESTLTFAEAVMVYVADGKSAEYLKPLVRYFKDRTAASIRPGDIQSAARDLYLGRAPATQNRQGIVPAKAVINHAANKGLCPPIRVRLFKETPPAKRAAPPGWHEAFAAAAPNPRLAALAWFNRETAARIGQAIEIRWSDVSLQTGEVVIPAAKGFPERIAYLTPRIVAMLASLPGERRGRVFGYTSRSSIYRPWRATCAKAGIPYLTTHPAGRHTFFTETIVRNGVDPKTAAELGGSASPALLLKTYVHPENPRAVIQRVFGTPASQSRTEAQAQMRKRNDGSND